MDMKAEDSRFTELLVDENLDVLRVITLARPGRMRAETAGGTDQECCIACCFSC
jgi:hypothetical protein